MKTPRTHLTKHLLVPLAAALFILGGAASAWGQTNPTAQSLPYSADFGALAWSSTTYPAGWQGWQIGTAIGSSYSTAAPTANVALAATGSASGTTGGAYNYRGRLGLLGSGSMDASLVLALNTTGSSSVGVAYDIVTIRNPQDGSNTRVNQVTLQYRVGTSGEFTTLAGIDYENPFGSAFNQVGAGVTLPQNVKSRSVVLPATCDNQPVVQVRWACRDLSGSGARPSFAVDNVRVTAGGTHLIVASAGVGGSISPSGTTLVTDGTSPTYSITPIPGYSIAGVWVDGGMVGAVSSYTFPSIDANHTIVASFLVTTPGSGMVAHWRLNWDGSDASGNLNQASFTGSPEFAAGVEAVAPLFNGSSQYGSVPNSASLSITGPVTIAAWVRPEKTGTQTFVTKALNSSADGYEITGATTGLPFFRLNQRTSADLYRVNSTVPYPTDGVTWMHVAGTYDGTTMRLYINGVLNNSVAGPTSILSSTAGLGIGSQYDGTGTRLLQGAVDEARVYNRALSAAEIAALAGLPTYTITASAGAGGSISPAGTTVVAQNGSQTYTITPDGGAGIADVLVDGASVGTPTSYTFSSVTGDHTIAASFSSGPYTLAVTTTGSGSVDLSPPGGSYPAGTTVTLTATAAAGSHFVRWIGDLTGSSNPATITMYGNRTVTAEFQPDFYTLTVTTAGNGSGTVSKAPDTPTYSYGTNVQLTPVPATGSSFTGWSGDLSGAANPATLTMDGNKSVTATFTLNTYTLDVTTSGSGSVARSPDQPSYDHGSSVTLTATAAPGWHFVAWGSDLSGSTNPAILTMDANKSVTASFEMDATASTVDAGPASGMITLGNPTVTVPVRITRAGATPAIMAFSVVFTVSQPALELPGGRSSIALPAGGGFLNADGGRTLSFQTIDKGGGTYQADGAILGAPCGSSALSGTLFEITLGSAALGGSGTVTINSVKLRDCTNADIPPVAGATATVLIDRSAPAVAVTAPNGGETWYVGETRAIAWTAADPEGVTSVDLSYSTDGGATYTPITTLTGTPPPATHDWLVAGPATSTALVRALAHDVNGNTASDASDATFTISTHVTINATVTGGHGTITPSGAVSVPYGASQTFDFTPDPGYHVATVTVDGSGVPPEASYTFTAVTVPHSIDVTFALNTYALDVTVSGSGTVTKSPDQPTYEHGSTVVLAATAAPGWHFVGWSGDASGAENPLTVTMDGPKSITATFALNTYALDVTVSGSGTVTKTPDQPTYEHGSTVVLAATATPGWHFVGWSGDASGAENPLTVTMDGPKSITATFALNTYALDVTVTGSGTVTKTPDQPTYEHGTVVTLGATAAPGWHFVGWSGDASGAENPLTVTMDGPKSITATFEANPPVAAVTIEAAQARTGNPPGQTTGISITWPALPAGCELEIFRGSFGNYPEYDDSPNEGSPAPLPVPANTYPPGPRWVPVAQHLTGTSYTDAPAGRDYYYYAAYVTDGYGTRSEISNRVEALDYHLGDVTDGATPGTGNNLLNTADISLLGNNYGLTGPAVLACDYLDVGPTATMHVDALPATDNAIDFEDLVVFAMNYGLVSGPQASARPANGGSDALVLERPATVAPGAEFTVKLMLRGSGALRALSSELSWDPAVATPIGQVAGDWLSAQSGVAFSARPGKVDAAVLGAMGMSGDGLLATVTFRALAAGDPRIEIATADGRDLGNRRVPVTLSQQLDTPQAPAVTRLAFVGPNPFRGAATVAFSLAERGAVELAIYSVEGRCVRTLVREARDPGEYREAWDGRDDRGNLAPAGVYYAHLAAGKARFTRTIVHLR